MNRNIKNYLFLTFCLTVGTFCHDTPSDTPDLYSVKNAVGDLNKDQTNCKVINSMLATPAGQKLYIHGWEKIGSKEDGYVYFIAGFEAIPTSKWLVLSWRIKNKLAIYEKNPTESVKSLVKAMASDRYNSGPGGSMEVMPDLDACAFKNMDYYHGEHTNFSEVLHMRQSIKKWDKAVQLPYYNLEVYLGKP